MHGSAAQCDCCGKREQAGQCVIGRVMCPCETDDDCFIHRVSLCPDCDKCPAHCYCDPCDCGFVRNTFLFHNSDCPARIACRERIAAAKAEHEKLMAKLKEGAKKKSNEIL